MTTPRLLERCNDHERAAYPIGYSFRCGRCHSRFAIDLETDYFIGKYTGAYYATCPNCNLWLTLRWWGSRRLKPGERVEA